MNVRKARAASAMAVMAALISAIALTGCATRVETVSSGNPLANTVTAPGTGKISGIPDQAVMSFGVSSQAKDAKAALDKVSAKAAAISSAVQRNGVAEQDIQTANVSVDPQYGTPRPNGQAPVVGYQASLSVTAKVRDLNALSKVIGAASAAGVDNINGPSFSINEDSKYRQQAIAKAVDDARVTAAAMAKAAGKQLGDVVSVSSSDSGTQPAPLTAYADLAAKAPVPIERGQLDVTANVNVVFALK